MGKKRIPRIKGRELTLGEQERYKEALERQRLDAEKRRQEEFKPKEEFIASVGVCEDSLNQSHQVFKITTYGYESDTSSIIGPGSGSSIRERTRYCCKTCKVAFDRSIDPDYQEPPHPVPHRHAWY
jgi:hypothetical protein